MKIVSPVFAQFTLLPNPVKILCFIMLSSRPDAPKVPLPVGASTSPCNACSVPDSAFQTASRSVQPFVHSSRQTVPILYSALHGDVDARTGRGTFGASGRLESIIKHRILTGFGKRVDQSSRSTCHMTCFCAKSRLLWGHDDCRCVKIFSGVNFLIATNSLTR